MEVTNYKDLEVWQMSMELAQQVYTLARKLPKDELFGLTNQMRRAVVSIPSNIAEGKSRDSTKEYVYFVSIAKGSNAELETHLLLCHSFGYLSEEEIGNPLSLVDKIGKMLNALSRALKRKLEKEKK